MNDYSVMNLNTILMKLGRKIYIKAIMSEKCCFEHFKISKREQTLKKKYSFDSGLKS